MRLIYKSKAWKIILSDLMICRFLRGIKFIEPKSKETVINIKTSYDYYADIYQMKCLHMLFALTWNNQIDVYDMKTGELIQTLKWKGSRRFERERLAIDEENKCIYYILYCDEEGENESLVSIIDCVGWKERIVSSLPGFYASDFQYCKKEREYIIMGRQFCKFPKSLYLTGIDKGIGMNSGKEILFDQSNKWNVQTFTAAKLMDNGDMLYFIRLKRGKVYRLGEKSPILDKVDETAFSHDGKYIAYLRKGKITVLEYDSWKVVDTVESDIGLVHVFEFEDSDKHIIYQVDDVNYLFEIEFATVEKQRND